MTTQTFQGEYRPTALELPPGLTFDAWADVLAGLGAMAQGHQWWIGDALIYGEERFGEDAAAGFDRLGLQPQTMLNYRWVAAAVETSRRREDLSWSHHAEVARLHARSQTKMLAEAADHAWTVRQLRDAVAIRYPETDQPELPGDAPPVRKLTDSDQASIARRLEGITVALEHARENPTGWYQEIDLDDVEWLVRILRHLTRHGDA